MIPNNHHEQAETYQAQVAYRDETVAAEYDRRRFKHLRGRLGDRLDKRSLKSALDCLSGREGIILDVPCGTGRMTSYMAALGYKVMAVDISVQMITVARSRLAASPAAPLHYIQADATRLPFRSKAFACATAIRFMGHLPSVARIQTLRELARVSQEYVIADYCVYHPLVNIRRRFERWFRPGNLGFNRVWTWEAIPRRQLESEFQAANLQPVRRFAKLRFFSDAWTVLLAPRDTPAPHRADEAGAGFHD